MEAFQVEQIDHVHVHVSDREAAAAWYRGCWACARTSNSPIGRPIRKVR
jgi:hypothetical protein